MLYCLIKQQKEIMNTDSITYANDIDIAAEQQRFMTKVFGWMAFALAITGLTAMFTISSPFLLNLIFGNRLVFFGLIIAEFVLVGSLVSMVHRLSAQTATLLFFFYSILNGITLSSVFLVYTASSIASTFYITAGTFGVMSLYGYFTKTDLTKAGNLLVMALIGIVIASVVNLFLNSESLYWIITYAGILIFTGLIAYDTQKIKRLAVIGNHGSDIERKGAILGALSLYLDFINLFLLLLRLFGRRR